MNILALNGSPRGRRSNTDRLLLPMLEGARGAGATTEVLYMNDLNVQPCKGCFSCWGRTPGKCVQDDDMPLVLERILDSDVLIWAFPLYCYGMPALLQAVQERMLPLVKGDLIPMGDVHGHPLRYPGKKLHWVVLSNCGFPEQRHFDALVMKFRQLAGAAGGGEPIDFILMAAGELLRAVEDDPEAREPLEALRADLRAAGEELAELGRLKDTTREGLSRPITERFGLSPDLYARAANENWAAMQREAEG
jgi:multimeric flavodoxin WrbA